MFSELVGSTALASRMDPEDLREIISSYQKCVAELSGGCKRTLEICFCIPRVVLWRLEHDFTSEAMYFGFEPPFFCCLDCRYGFPNTEPTALSQKGDVRIDTTVPAPSRARIPLF